MNYIGLWLLKGESLSCGSCGDNIQNDYAFLWGYQGNTSHTAEVMCGKCFKETQVKEDITLLEGVLGQ